MDGPLIDGMTERTPRFSLSLSCRHEKLLKGSLAEGVTKGNVLLHAYLYRLKIPKRFNKVRSLALHCTHIKDCCMRVLCVSCWVVAVHSTALH